MTGVNGGEWELESVKRDIQNIQETIADVMEKNLNGPPSCEGPIISIGGFAFNGDQDVLVWMEKYLSPNFNFGAFLDVYELLARFVTRKGEDMARAMEARAKVVLTASEEITLETFRQPLPIIFGKCADGSALMARGVKLPC